MDFSKMLGSLQGLADANDDGKISIDDLSKLKDSIPEKQFNDIKDMIDKNGDGKISIDELKKVDWSGLSGVAGGLGKLFGDKK